MNQDKHIPIILFGAFDRHNFGDLLFPHIAAALLRTENLLFAGLAERDLRGYGGHKVSALARLAAQWNEHPARLIHVGGEILTCDAWQAAIMLQPTDLAQHTIARLDTRAAEKQAWAHQELGMTALAPYTLSRAHFPQISRVVYAGVGGVDLNQCPPLLRAEVLANLRAAEAVSVRDSWTHAQLGTAGIPAQLIPDPAVMVAALFGEQIHQRLQNGEVARIAAAFPQGYVAVQFSADFGDDATLTAIASQLDRASAENGLGSVFFRAGAAPWHDDLACYERIAARMYTPVRIFTSLDLWDICALIANSSIYCGSSLHGRIVAMAFALPRINLIHPSQGNMPSKQAAFARTWEAAGIRATVNVSEIAQGIRKALATNAGLRQQIARQLVAAYRQGFSTLDTALA